MKTEHWSKRRPRWKAITRSPRQPHILALAVLMLAAAPARANEAHQVVAKLRSLSLSPDGKVLYFRAILEEVPNLSKVERGISSAIQYEAADSQLALSIAVRVTTLAKKALLCEKKVVYETNRLYAVALPKWDCKTDTLRVEIWPSGEKCVNVTDRINKLYHYPRGYGLSDGLVWLTRERVPFEFLYLGQLGRWFSDSIERGGAISVILLCVMLPWGIAVSIYHLNRLFLSPKCSVRLIRFEAKAEKEAGELHSLAKDLLQELAVRIRRTLLVRKGQKIHRMELRRWERIWTAKISLAASGLIGAYLQGESNKRGKTVPFMDFIPTSLDSLWNAAVLSPLLGLLGTVVGISTSFGKMNLVIVTQGSKKAMSVLSSGINTALYTTVDGLAVGVIFMIVYYVCQRRARTIVHALEETGQSFWQRTIKKLVSEDIQVIG